MSGDLYLELGPNKERATKYLLQVYELDPDYRFDMLYKIGLGYQYGLQFDDAIEYYNMYLNKLKKEKRYFGEDRVPEGEVERRIYECKNGKEYYANAGEYSIINIGTQINSQSHDFAPVFNQDETFMVFTTRRQESNLYENVDDDNFYFEDIFFSRKVNGTWTPAKNIGSIVNTLYHDSNLALSADGQELYLYRSENGGDIYVSYYEGKDTIWTEPEPLGGNINSSFSENSISVSPDGSLLFFSSDRPGGQGGLDIYISERDSRGLWGKVTNLGTEINTPSDEDGPFIDYDGKTLYFSSRGHKGMGGFDIYKTEYDSAESSWSSPVNMGYPINTPDDDIYFVSTQDGKRGYYASVRDDGMGYTDIYMVTIPESLNERQNRLSGLKNIDSKDPDNTKKDLKPVENKPANTNNTENQDQANNENNASENQNENSANTFPVILDIKIVDASNGQPVNAKLQLRRVSDNVITPVNKIDDGAYRFNLKNEQEDIYYFSAEKYGYAFKNFKVKLPGTAGEPQNIFRTIKLDKLEEGYSSVLRNLYFDFGSAKFNKRAFSELNKLEEMLRSNPGMVVEIGGHTDNVGPEHLNQKMSEIRAIAVVDYLAGKGIDRTRMKAVGYGESRPIASNDDEKDGREFNRRVEFKVLGM